MSKILYIDKPKGITSFDLCFKLRKVFNTKKIGHTGTLDPNATGLMVCLIDGASKTNQFLVSANKEYIATVKLGIRTDSEDIDGNILEEKEEVMPSFELIVETIKSFIGKSEQIPPMASAIKINGKKLYEYMRNNETVELKPRPIEVFSIELLDVADNTFTISCKVSSGTYIRTLVQDILKKLGVIGTLSDLRRTAIDDISLDEADTLEEVLNGNYHAHSIYEVLSKYYEVYVAGDAKAIKDGKPLKYNSKANEILCVDGDNTALAIYRKENGVYRCVRGLL